MKKYMNQFFHSNRSVVFYIITAFLLLDQTFLVYAQPGLSYEDAISTGLSNNYGIRVARNNSNIASCNISYGNSGILPSVSAYGSWDNSSFDAKVKTSMGSEIDRESASVKVITAGVMAQWTLFNGAGMFFEYNKLKSLANMSMLDLRITIESSIFDITSAYFYIVKQQQLTEAIKKSLEISNMRLHLATLKYESGSGSEQEMLQAEVIRLSDTTALTRQLANLKKAKVQLNELLATDVQKDYIAKDSIVLAEIPLLDQLIKDAVGSNVQYLHSEEAQRYSDLELKLLRSKRLPSLVLKGSYGYYENDNQTSFISYNRTIGPQIGISAGISLFDGMNLNRKISNAKVLLENEGIRLKENEQKIIAAIVGSWYEHQSLLQMVELCKKGLGLAEKNMLIAGEAFQSGLISSFQLREAQDDLFKASSDLYDALYNAKVKETEILMLSGALIKQ